jgi:hypothetical protein
MQFNDGGDIMGTAEQLSRRNPWSYDSGNDSSEEKRDQSLCTWDQPGASC